MPRLVGKKTNVAIGTGVVVVLLIAIAIILESFGVIDLVPNFGKKTRSPITEIHLMRQV